MSERIGPARRRSASAGDVTKAQWFDSIVSSETTPGRISLPPPPAPQWFACAWPIVILTSRSRDLVVQPDRRAARGDADVAVGVGVARVVLEERDPHPLHAREVVTADLHLGVGLGHREDLAVRADHDRVGRSRRPRARRRWPGATSTAAWAGTGCRSRSRRTCRPRSARRTAARRPAARAPPRAARSRRRQARGSSG